MHTLAQTRKDSNGLADDRELFERNVIMPFKKHRDRTPEPSECPSGPSFENVKAQTNVDITLAPKNHQDAKEQAFIRDNWRCVVTGVIDNSAPDDIVAQLDPDFIETNTQLAHIIPKGILSNVEPKSDENAEHQRVQWEQVHSLTNVITLERNTLDKFDELELYFDATPQKDHYEIKSYGGKPHPHIRRSVTFSTADPENPPVPLPDLLALRATCCKMAHLSGSTKHIDDMSRDADRMDVLSGDGSSGDVLHYMLEPLPNSAVGVRS